MSAGKRLRKNGQVPEPAHVKYSFLVLLGLPTPADEIPGDFFESLENPGVLIFLLYKRPSLPILISYFLLFSLT